MTIGFIGQGWIGKHHADEFESRMFNVVRYSLEEPYVHNKEQISECDVVFIAVPTPTTEHGFDESSVRDALALMGEAKVAVIKSTLLPGTTEKLQNEFPDIFILHSPEFLAEKTAVLDVANPKRNIIGIPVVDDVFQEKAEMVLRILPEAPYNKVMPAKDAEMVKYAGNCFLLSKVVFMNLLYDLVDKTHSNWASVHEAMIHDPRIGESHTSPILASKRGAGGRCFIKDFEAFRQLYTSEVGDAEGVDILNAIVQKNITLLRESNKDLDLLEGVYGKDFSIES